VVEFVYSNMVKDKYTATWVSYSSISDFLACPRAYFLKNVYRDSQSGNKIKLISPPLALGQAVHEVIEQISKLPVVKRFKTPLVERFDVSWEKVSGKKGGFTNEKVENEYKKRGEAMLTKLVKKPGILANLAVKIKMDLPYYWLSEDDDIILCGKIDWLEYLPDTDSVHIIDFKTGKKDEDSKSLQLPIYQLLVTNTQKRSIAKVSYWYIERSDKPVKQKLPDFDKSGDEVLKIAKEIKLARKLERFKCPKKTGCKFCNPYEAVVRGDAEFVGTGNYGEDIYIAYEPESVNLKDSEIL